MGLKNLRKAREITGMNQKEFSEKLAMSQQRYHQYESGKREPDSETLTLIASELGVTMDYLFGVTNNPTPIDTKKEALAEKWLELTKEDIELINITNNLTDYRRALVLKFAHDLNLEQTQLAGP